MCVIHGVAFNKSKIFVQFSAYSGVGPVRFYIRDSKSNQAGIWMQISNLVAEVSILITKTR